MAFLYDELAVLVRDGALDEKLVDKLSQMAEGGITELYLADIPDDGHGSEEYWMNLDGSEAALALKLRLIVEQADFQVAGFQRHGARA